MLRHASYRQERPWLSVLWDLGSALRRPRHIVLMLFALGTAAHFGVPVSRAVPAPVKHAYADGRAWQTRNAVRLGCFQGHTAAMQSNDERRMDEAARKCERMRQQAER